MQYVERRFTQIDPPTKEVEARPFSAFAEQPAIVLLGDPGLGKTTELRHLAANDADGLFVSVRRFLNAAPDTFRNRTVYLDALDEQRTWGRDGYAVVDQVVSRLQALDRPRFRISCRAADWYGSIDVEELQTVSPGNKVTVLRLDPLSEEDVRQAVTGVVPNPEAFVTEARQRGIEDLLLNPETLRLLSAVVRNGSWPRTRTDLFEKAAHILVRESNEVHGRVAERQIELTPVLETAGLLCALILCSDIEGFALSDPAANEDFVAASAAPGDVEKKRIVLTSRIFSAVEPEKMAPVHRTTAEFLAGRFLSLRASQGLPVGRILSLITGHDGGTLTELRGLFAWFTTLDASNRIGLSDRDPLGAILYGDVAAFSPGEKKSLFASLARLEKENPYFRAENWSARPFGPLATPDMDAIFLELLTSPDVTDRILDCALDALNNGQPLPSLAPALLRIVRDNRRAEGLRTGALLALIAADPKADDLQSLLDEVHSGILDDDDRRLRGHLLSALYPKQIPPTRIPHYLIKDAPHFTGSYWQFLRHGLVPHTPIEALPTLGDACIAAKIFEVIGADEFAFRDLAGQVVSALLVHHGELESPGRLYSWLRLGVDEYSSSVMEKEDREVVQAYFREHPNVLHALLRHHIDATPPENLSRSLIDFEGLVQHAPDPVDHGQWLLRLALDTEDIARARAIFIEAIRHSWANISDLTLDDLWAAAAARNEFKETLDQWSVQRLDEWRLRHARERKERETQRKDEVKARRDSMRANLLPHRELIRGGKAWQALHVLAQIYLCRFSDLDAELPPYVRLSTEVGDDLARDAEAGFDAVLRADNLPTPAALGKLCAQGKRPASALPVIVGVERLYGQSPRGILALPDTTLAFALPAYLADHASRDDSWPDLLIRERPQLVADALVDFWGAQIRADVEFIYGLHEIEQVKYAAVARMASLPLLRRHLKIKPRALETILTAALSQASHAELLALARARTKGRTLLEEEVTGLWLGTGFLLAPVEFGPRIHAWVGKKKDRAWTLLEFVPEFLHKGIVAAEYRVLALERLLRVLGAYFPPAEPVVGVRVGKRHPDDAARVVAGLIDLLGADLSETAGIALQRCRIEKSLAPWRDRCTYVHAMRARKQRDARYKRVSFAEAASTLMGGAPANVADLQALSVDHLRRLAHEIRHGNLDGYKTFWNLSGQKIAEPVAEEIARDRLIERLRDRLAPLQITAEPEARYAEQKRADVRLGRGFLALPIEVKRNYHKDIWTAPEAQLKTLYARDPGAADRGIYLVFWFGHVKPSWKTPLNPDTRQRPESAQQLENMLRDRLSAEDRARLEIVVIDCAPPPSGKQSVFGTGTKIGSTTAKPKKGPSKIGKAARTVARATNIHDNKNSTKPWRKKARRSKGKVRSVRRG